MGISRGFYTAALITDYILAKGERSLRQASGGKRVLQLTVAILSSGPPTALETPNASPQGKTSTAHTYHDVGEGMTKHLGGMRLQRGKKEKKKRLLVMHTQAFTLGRLHPGVSGAKANHPSSNDRLKMHVKVKHTEMRTKIGYDQLLKPRGQPHVRPTDHEIEVRFENPAQHLPTRQRHQKPGTFNGHLKTGGGKKCSYLCHQDISAQILCGHVYDLSAPLKPHVC